MSQDYVQLNAQWRAFNERRGELYRALERLRQEEEAFFRIVRQSYVENSFTSSSKEFSLEVILGFRQRHDVIFSELQEIRLEIAHIAAEMRAL